MKTLIVGIALCCIASPLVAQVRTGSSKTRTSKERIQKKVAAMRKAMRQGKIQEFNAYVKVKLKNGNRMRGVVKNGRFVELHDGFEFVSAARVDDKGAGMRVWYTAGTASYVFLRYEDIERYVIGSRLSDKQVRALETKLEDELAQTRANYQRLRDAKNKGAIEKLVEEKAGPDPAADLPKLTEKQSALLLDYPPQSGWSESKLKQLKQRRITLGVFPNKKEKRFEEVYGEWKQACEAWEKLQKAELEAAQKKKAAGAEKSDKPKPAPAPAPAKK